LPHGGTSACWRQTAFRWRSPRLEARGARCAKRCNSDSTVRAWIVDLFSGATGDQNADPEVTVLSRQTDGGPTADRLDSVPDASSPAYVSRLRLTRFNVKICSCVSTILIFL
jgi:hypothetical protein